MKNKLLVMALLAAIVTLTGCANAADQAADDATRAAAEAKNKTAMQKRYTTQDECQKDFPVAGDCTRITTNTAGMNGTGASHSGFIPPYFFMWGAIMHSNGSMSYNNRVPTSGFYRAPAAMQSRIASRTNFSRAPSSYSSSRGGSTVRGGFGSSARGSSGG